MRSGWPPRREVLVVAGLLVVVVTPLAVAVASLAGQHWYPTGDLAQAELRVRSFWAHPPLVGAAGRIGTLQNQGAHPGPFMFWAAWPGYWVLGRSSWALLASVATVNSVVVGAILAVAYRRARLPLTFGVAVAVALLLHGYGASVLTQPWNPSMPLLPWLLFLLLVWSALCGDLPLLPWAVVAGSYCVQSHVGYTALVGGLLVGAVIWVLVEHWRGSQGAQASQGSQGSPGSQGWARLGRWLVLSIGAGVVVWIPPIIDQIQNRPGNLSILYDYFAHPNDTVLGFGHGVRLVLVQLDPFGGWLTGREATTGPVLPGVVLLVLWLAGVVVAWRRRHRLLIRLHAMVAAALVLAVASAARIFGFVFVYLVKWAWGITALTVVATVWSLALLVTEQLDSRSRHRAAPLLGTAAAAAIAGSTIAFGIAATGIDVPGPPYSATVGALAPTTAAHLDRSGRYLVEWEDPIALGADGFGMLLELERRGFHVGAPQPFRAAVEPHRVLAVDRATASLHVITGPANIAAWRATPGVRQLAYADNRTPAQRREYLRLEAKVTAELRADGLGERVPDLQSSLIVLGLRPDVPSTVAHQLGRMVDIGLPVAVFLAPATMGTPAPRPS